MNTLPSIRTIVLLMVGALLIGGGATYWASGAASAAKTRYAKLASEVPEEKDLEKMVADSQLKVDDYKNQLNHLEEGVPNLAYVPTLLTELETLGKEHNIAVTGVRPIVADKISKNNDDKASGSEKKPSYQEMSIDITGRGSYADVMQVVEALKKFPKILSIQTVGLNPKKDAQKDKSSATTTVQLDATVRIKAYLFPLPDKSADSKPGQTGATS